MTADEWKRRQAELSALAEDFEASAAAALAWYADWKARQSRFRCTRRPKLEAAE